MNQSQTGAQTGRTGLYALFAANLISFVGNNFNFIAVPWFVLQTTGSATQTGITAFFQILPFTLAAVVGGNLVDRLGYKRTSIIADAASAVTVGLIPLLYSTIGLEFWQLLVLVFIGNLLDAPGSTARQAILPDLAEKAGMGLERVSTATQVIERGSRLLGAPTAGLLVSVIGASQVLWIDAASFGISALLVWLFVPGIATHRDADETGSYWARITAGFRYIWQDRLLRLIVTTVLVTNLLDAAQGGVIQPVYIQRYFGNALNFGLLVAITGGGSVVGALLFSAFGHRLNLSRRAVFVSGFLIIGLIRFVYVFVPPFWVMMCVATIIGLASGPLNPIIGTTMLTRVPAHLRGRVLGAVAAGATAGSPLGVLAVGFLLDLLDIRLIITSVCVIYVAITLVALFDPASRTMNTAE